MDWTELLFPRTCPACGGPIAAGQTLCAECERRVARNTSPYCPFCGVSAKDCRCAHVPRPYDHLVAPFYYEGAVRDTILRLKFGKKEEGARFLSAELRKEVEARFFGESFDIVTVVPMSRARYAERGFNQARVLAELLMADPPAPLSDAVADYGLLKKVRSGSGAMQHLLGAESRRENIRGSIRVGANRELSGKRVLLIDDIVTTGATAGECAAMLRMEGAASVSVAAAAVTRYTGAQADRSKEKEPGPLYKPAENR